MTTLILHHYDGSPFSEKVRLVFGLKGLAWRSVKVPVMLPKPDVMALTGGYRRTPFLQLGADVYCDSALMCRVIDQLAPAPPLYPAEAGPLQHIVAQWADSALFWCAIPYTMQPAGIVQIFAGAPPEFLKAFGADRAAMTAGRTRVTSADAAAQLASFFGWLEALLGDDRRYLLGAAACIADFSVAQSIWFIRRAPAVATVLAPFPHLLAWYERVAAFGHGHVEPMTAEQAIAVSAASPVHAPTSVDANGGFASGTAVTVTPTDYAADPVAGALVGLGVDEVVIERHDDRAGRVHVHFPRIGFQIKAQA